MNSKQRRQFMRLKARKFPRGCRVRVRGHERHYIVEHHFAGSFDCSPLISVRAADLINRVAMTAHIKDLSVVAPAVNSATEKPATTGET